MSQTRPHGTNFYVCTRLVKRVNYQYQVKYKDAEHSNCPWSSFPFSTGMITGLCVTTISQQAGKNFACFSWCASIEHYDRLKKGWFLSIFTIWVKEKTNYYNEKVSCFVKHLFCHIVNMWSLIITRKHSVIYSGWTPHCLVTLSSYLLCLHSMLLTFLPIPE